MPNENKQLNLNADIIAAATAADIDGETLLQRVIQVSAIIESCVRWAQNYRPRLVHLAVHAKRRRARKKNTTRIIREYLREV